VTAPAQRDEARLTFLDERPAERTRPFETHVDVAGERELDLGAAARHTPWW